MWQSWQSWQSWHKKGGKLMLDAGTWSLMNAADYRTTVMCSGVLVI